MEPDTLAFLGLQPADAGDRPSKAQVLKFAVLGHVFGFISVENLDKYSILEKTKTVLGE